MHWLPCLALLAACSSTASPQAPAAASSSAAPPSASIASAAPTVRAAPSAVPTSSASAPSAAAAIDELVARLAESHGLWVNGASPILDAPASAPTRAVLQEMFGKISFDEGKVTTFDVVEERDVTIPPDTMPVHAARITTNLGPAVVLLRHESGWWTRVYRSPPP